VCTESHMLTRLWLPSPSVHLLGHLTPRGSQIFPSDPGENPNVGPSPRAWENSRAGLLLWKLFLLAWTCGKLLPWKKSLSPWSSATPTLRFGWIVPQSASHTDSQPLLREKSFVSSMTGSKTLVSHENSNHHSNTTFCVSLHNPKLDFTLVTSFDPEAKIPLISHTTRLRYELIFVPPVDKTLYLLYRS
jgi:hypothetical protein